MLYNCKLNVLSVSLNKHLLPYLFPAIIGYYDLKL